MLNMSVEKLMDTSKNVGRFLYTVYFLDKLYSECQMGNRQMTLAAMCRYHLAFRV